MESSDVLPALATALALVALVAAIGTFYYFSVLIHELGHMFAALCVGWKPVSLCIGHGTRRTVFSIGDIDFQTGRRPSGGMVQACARRPQGFRSAQFIFALGGPFASACFACGLFLAADSMGQAETTNAWTDWIWILFGLECWFLAGTLWPRIVNFTGELLPSDGLLLWRTLWIKRSEVPALYLGHAMAHSAHLLRKGQVEAARLELSRGAVNEFLPQEDGNRHLYWIYLLLAADREEDARTECQRLLRDFPAGDTSRVEVFDQIASIPVFHGRRALIPEALEFIEAAICEAPDNITLKGTKGSLLIDHGHVDLGMQLLAEVERVSASEIDQGISAWYLALGYLKQGDTMRAEEKLALARTKYPNCVVATRLEGEIKTLAAHTKETELAHNGVFEKSN